jgi:hypothetical protein
MRVTRARVAGFTISRVLAPLVVCSLAVIAGGCSTLWMTAPPSSAQQGQEVAALEQHVLPVVRDLKVTWYLREGVGDGSLYWQRGKFTRDKQRARDDGDQLFDGETEAAFEQMNRAIRTSGVPMNRLVDAQYAADGTLRFASFRRSGGGIKFVFNYIYSPGAKPPEWRSPLGPVVLTRIGESDWWFEQSPDD